MTATSEATVLAVDSPRSVLDAWPGLFEKLVTRVQDDYATVATFYAELAVEQAIAYMATAAVYDAENPPVPIDDGFNMLTPSRAVDVAVHAFIDFTREWREVSAKLTGGKFLDHIPVTNDSIESGRSLDLTVRVMRHYGWNVDDRMWERGASCGSSDNCGLSAVKIS